MSYDVGAIIAEKIQREFVWNYSIKRHERYKASKAWHYCRIIDRPLNTLLTFEFEQGSDPNLDAQKVRRLLNYVRITIKRMGVHNYCMYSRHVKLGTRLERVMLVCYVPNESWDKFKDQPKGWNIDSVISPIEVRQVDYSKCLEMNGEHWTVFDVMCRNLDPVTRRREPGLLFEASEPIYKPCLFYSIKVAKAISYPQPNGILIEQE